MLKKLVNFILALLPIIIYFVMQFAALIFFAVIDRNFFSNLDKYVNYIRLMQALMGIVVFGLWYKIVFKDIERQPLMELFSIKRLLGVFVMAVCLQIVVTVLINAASIWFKDLIENYSEFMEDFVGKQTVSLVLYTVLFAPLAEELVFRAVTFNHLRRALPFWLANIIQAALFGIMHMNIVQGTYAFLLGLVLGIVYKKYNSLYANTALHMFINLSGFMIPIITSPILMLILVFGSFFGSCCFLIMLLKDR